MPKQIKVTDELYERLKARANGQPIPQLLRSLLDGEELRGALKNDLQDAILEQLDESVPGAIVDMSDWVDGEAPACCIDTIANSFKPGHICPDWVRLEYTDKNGLRRQNWFNKRTGEYEFSERWKKIKSEYEYQ